MIFKASTLADYEIPDQEFTPELRNAGWAPGNYVCRCVRCEKRHIADKRAPLCLGCARKKLL